MKIMFYTLVKNVFVRKSVWIKKKTSKISFKNLVWNYVLSTTNGTIMKYIQINYTLYCSIFMLNLGFFFIFTRK